MRSIEDYSADEVIDRLGLQAHPEGSYYRETYRHEPPTGRGAVTQIYFLLKADEPSAWHKVDANEIWHFYAGAPLVLSISQSGGAPVRHRLGKAHENGDALHWVVPEGAWQSAATEGAWTLVGCTVAPAFEFEGFTLAPEGWEPGR